MKKTFRNSLGKKVFLIIALFTVISCGVIYGFVMYSLPSTFRYELETKFEEELNVLIRDLETTSVEEQESAIISFCTRNNASVSIMDMEQTEIFGINSTSYENLPGDTLSTTIIVSFENPEGEFMLHATISLIAANETHDILVGLIPIVLIITVVVSAVGAVLFAKWYAKPLTKISDVSKKMAALDLTPKCETNRTDEIGILSQNLNSMSDKLGQNITELKTANESLAVEIEKGKKVEKQRLDFFTAVSHELKTPITAIKGELEGMIHGVGEYKNHDKYLRTAMRTTSRMEKLVQEILTAAKMESDDFALQKTAFSFSDLVKKCVRDLQGLAEDKGMELNLNIENDVSYEGDYELLKKAISNIIGNAVFHSPTGAIINVALTQDELTVLNSGVTLEPGDIEQLFNPFYRVDKSHNSNTGGSGIGLYIVKTVFDRHGIDCKIENDDNGVKFMAQI